MTFHFVAMHGQKTSLPDQRSWVMETSLVCPSTPSCPAV